MATEVHGYDDADHGYDVWMTTGEPMKEMDQALLNLAQNETKVFRDAVLNKLEPVLGFKPNEGQKTDLTMRIMTAVDDWVDES